MKLLAIIVTYNAMQWIERCIPSLLSSTLHPDVFVVDNGSLDGTQDFIRKYYPKVLFHHSSENLGFGMANNMGLQYALDNDYDYVYLLNQDAWILPNTLEELVNVSRSYPQYGVLSPFQMESDLYHFDNNFCNEVLIYGKNIYSDMYNDNLNTVYEVPVVMAAHWLITKDCLQAVGGFSPSFKHYGEDYNYADRVRYHHFLIGIVPSLKVVHDRASREDSQDKMDYLVFTNNLRTLSNPEVKTIKVLISIIIQYLSIFFRTRNHHSLKYILRLLCNYSTIRSNRIISANRNCAFLNYQEN